MSGYRPSWRDRLAYRLASTALLIATPTYRAMLTGTWKLGLRRAVELAYPSLYTGRES